MAARNQWASVFRLSNPTSDAGGVVRDQRREHFGRLAPDTKVIRPIRRSERNVTVTCPRAGLLPLARLLYFIFPRRAEALRLLSVLRAADVITLHHGWPSCISDTRFTFPASVMGADSQVDMSPTVGRFDRDRVNGIDLVTFNPVESTRAEALNLIAVFRRYSRGGLAPANGAAGRRVRPRHRRSAGRHADWPSTWTRSGGVGTP